MKFPAGFISMFLLCYALNVQAQSSGLLIRIGTMQPTADLLDSNISKGSFRVNLGYGKVFAGGHSGFDITGFADVMSYNFYFDDDYKRFEGTTLYTGIAITPHYCINPEGEVQVAIALSIKGGYNVGYGDVYRYNEPREDYTDKLEGKSVGAGYTFAYSPMITLSIPGGYGSAGLELGYDSSNYGAGINRLRSKYYAPVKYNSGYLFIGVFFRLNH
jgi:hypothetical protein